MNINHKIQFNYQLRCNEDIKPGFVAFKVWVKTQHKNILTKGAIGRAKHYAFNQPPLIESFFEDGIIYLGNNAIEIKIRSLGTGNEELLICMFLQGGTEDSNDVFLFCHREGSVKITANGFGLCVGGLLKP